MAAGNWIRFNRYPDSGLPWVTLAAGCGLGVFADARLWAPAEVPDLSFRRAFRIVYALSFAAFVVIVTVPYPPAPPWWLKVAAFLSWIPFPAMSLFLYLRWEKVKGRLRQGLCPRCGYDLRASPGRCPECGRDKVTLRRAA